MDVSTTFQKFTAGLSITEAEGIRRELAAYLNELLLHDFSALVQILYRVDVSEQKLKTVLKENLAADAGDLLAGLLIQRQQEKINAKTSFPIATESTGEDAW